MKIIFRISILTIFIHTFFYHELSAQTDSTVTISIAAVGDLMCHETQYLYAQVDSNSYDFRPVFEPVEPILNAADISIGNIETVFAGRDRTISGYPKFNTPDEFLDALSYAGFDVLVTANNHAYVMGTEGVLRTISEVRKRKMLPLGTYLSEKESDSLNIIDAKGVKIAMLAYTFTTNIGKPGPEESYLINYIRKDKIREDILKARFSTSDLVLVYFHFGHEYLREPTEWQIEVVNTAISAGADIILGCHPHVVQKVSLFKTKNAALDTGIVAYSLGNFVSNQRWRYSDGGVILKLNLEKNFTTGQMKMLTAEYQPDWVYKNEQKQFYKIYPMNGHTTSAFKNFSSEDSVAALQSFNDTKAIIESKSNKMILLKYIAPGKN